MTRLSHYITAESREFSPMTVQKDKQCECWMFEFDSYTSPAPWQTAAAQTSLWGTEFPLSRDEEPRGCVEFLRSWGLPSVMSVDHAEGPWTGAEAMWRIGVPEGSESASGTRPGHQSSPFFRLMFKHMHADPAISFEEFSPGSTPSHFGPRTWLQAVCRMKKKWKRAPLKCLLSARSDGAMERSSQPRRAECWFWNTDMKKTFTSDRPVRQLERKRQEETDKLAL